jgi:hypothetical protein
VKPVRDVVATQVFEEATEDEINTVASLVEMCLLLWREERPTMKQAESTLQYLRKKIMNSCQIVEGNNGAFESFVTSCQPPSLRSCKLPSIDDLWLLADVGSSLYVRRLDRFVPQQARKSIWLTFSTSTAFFRV